MKDTESVVSRGQKAERQDARPGLKVHIVRHGPAADQLVRAYKPEVLTGISSAEYVTTERSGDKMVVTHAGAFTDGDSEKDIFEKSSEDKASGKIPPR